MRNVISLHKTFSKVSLSIVISLIPLLSLAQNGDQQEHCSALARIQFATDLHLQIAKSELKNSELKSVEVKGSELKSTDKFCLIQGAVNSRVGLDGKNYAIGFEMRLPLEWNGKFLYQMNGGGDGVVVPAEGDSGLNAFGGKSARARGYAVLSTDAGHSGSDPENQVYGLAAGARFGLDPRAREDYGYSTTATMTPIAKEIIRAFYSKQPSLSYLAGCSNGGRHGMVAASRYGNMFNGILVGAPGFNLPKAALQHAWDIQSEQLVNSDIHKSFSRGDMSLIAKQILSQCDALDGAADGLVNNIRQCQRELKLDNLVCNENQSQHCLSEKQVHAFKRLMAGPTNTKGEALYSNWWYDAGVADEGWRFWKIESPIPPWDNNPLIATMGAGSLAYIFTTPATQVEGSPAKLLKFLSEFNFDSDAPKINAIQGDFKQSAMQFMTPPDAKNPTLKNFRNHHGKIIIYQGQSDPVFSTVDIVNWYEKLNSNLHGKANQFARMFVIPGMNHCAGGPATDQFDAFEALEKWVEKDIAPETIAASVNPTNPGLPADWSVKRTRALCAWPKISVYRKGDIESADSFVCSAP